jgi:hypothetical protein
VITQPEPEEKRKEKTEQNILLVLCFCVSFSHPEKPESGIETVVGRSDIKSRYREIAQAFELDFDFVNK